MRIGRAIFVSIAVLVVCWTEISAQENQDKGENTPAVPPQSRAMLENSVSPTIKSIASSHGASLGTGYIGHAGNGGTGVKGGLATLAPTGWQFADQFRPRGARREIRFSTERAPQIPGKTNRSTNRSSIELLSTVPGRAVGLRRRPRANCTSAFFEGYGAFGVAGEGSTATDANNINKTKPLIYPVR